MCALDFYWGIRLVAVLAAFAGSHSRSQSSVMRHGYDTKLVLV